MLDGLRNGHYGDVSDRDSDCRLVSLHLQDVCYLSQIRLKVKAMFMISDRSTCFHLLHVGPSETINPRPQPQGHAQILLIPRHIRCRGFARCDK